MKERRKEGRTKEGGGGGGGGRGKEGRKAVKGRTKVHKRKE